MNHGGGEKLTGDLVLGAENWKLGSGTFENITTLEAMCNVRQMQLRIRNDPLAGKKVSFRSVSTHGTRRSQVISLILTKRCE